jgi:outer membrane protein OmpA-like peptidoglycan-associated protein
MQPRFAALLFTLGLADLAYVNLGLGRELFPDVEAPAAPVATPAPSREAAPVDVPEREPSAPSATLPEPVTHNDLPNAPSPPGAPIPPPPATPEIEAAPADDRAEVAPHAGVARSDSAPPPAEEPASDLPESKLTITFPDTASAWIGGRARADVLALAARLRDRRELRVHVIGHADARGTPEFNLNLGGRRARAVTELLARAGVPRDQIEMESRGEAEPRSLGTSERVWAANRRVEISIGTGRNETP